VSKPIRPFGSKASDHDALSLSRDLRAALYRAGVVASPELPTRPIATLHFRLSATGPQGLCAELPSVALAGEAVRAVEAQMPRRGEAA